VTLPSWNTDQGGRFTSPRFTKVLTDSGIRVSMDGQRLHRAAPAVAEIRIRLSQRLRDRRWGQGRDRSLVRIPQRGPTALGVRRQNTGRDPPGTPGRHQRGVARQTWAKL